MRAPVGGRPGLRYSFNTAVRLEWLEYRRRLLSHHRRGADNSRDSNTRELTRGRDTFGVSVRGTRSGTGSSESLAATNRSRDPKGLVGNGVRAGRGASRGAGDALSKVLESIGWYANFSSPTETYIVYPGRVFRYPRREPQGRAEAQAFGRTLGIPEHQLDWSE